MATQQSTNHSLPAWYLEVAKQELANKNNEKAEQFLLQSLKEDNSYLAAIICYGELLIEQRRFLEASALLANAYQTNKSDLPLASLYYMSLRRQGLLPQCINTCQEILQSHHSDSFITSELAVALVMTGNIDEAINIGKQAKKHTFRWQQWFASALLAKKDYTSAKQTLKDCQPLLSEVAIVELLTIELISKTSQSMRESYHQLNNIEYYQDRPVWAHFELMRYQDISNNIAIFDQPCESSLALDPVPYCPRATALSTIHYQEPQSKLEHYIEPTIDRATITKNIKLFRGICKELIDAGTFDLFKNNLNQLKARFAPDKEDFVQIMSTGRCGTLALYEFLKQSKEIIPYHTMQWQLIPPDRNHLLYRILSGNFDKQALTTLLSAYLQNRVAEIAFAYQNNATPVIINHWDTVFAPFLAELFPNSKFLHVWRADQNVFESIYGKNQFQNEQLRHSYFDANFPEGQFHCYFDDNLSMQQQISWYLLLTREYSLAFMETLESDRMISLRSEEFFNCELASFDKIKQIIPIADITEQDFISAFSRPVNQKKEKQQIKGTALNQQSDKIDGIVKQLFELGKFH